MKVFVVNEVVKIPSCFLPWFLSKRIGTFLSGEMFIRYCPSSEMYIPRCSGAHLLHSTGGVESFGQEMPTSALAKRSLILYRWSKQNLFFESLCEKHGRLYSCCSGKLCISLSQFNIQWEPNTPNTALDTASDLSASTVEVKSYSCWTSWICPCWLWPPLRCERMITGSRFHPGNWGNSSLWKAPRIPQDCMNCCAVSSEC